ncbi:MAG: hypothetical protein ACXWQO_16295 [Bdellovibrionota bacterium]
MPKLIALFLASLALLPSFAQASERGGGDEGPHGGDEVALEFFQALASSVTVAKLASPELYQKIIAAGLPGLVKLENILVVEVPLPVQKDGYTQESAATNDPASGKILINRTRWQSIKNLRLREAVALHEAASLKRIEDTGRYTFSREYISLFGMYEDDLENAAYYPPPPLPPARDGALLCGSGNGFMRTYLSEATGQAVTDTVCNTMVPDRSQRCSRPNTSLFDESPETWLPILQKALRKKNFPKISANELMDTRAQNYEVCGAGAIRNRLPNTASCLLMTVQSIYRHRVCGMPWEK